MLSHQHRQRQEVKLETHEERETENSKTTEHKPQHKETLVKVHKPKSPPKKPRKLFI